MKYPDFLELTALADNDILLVYEASTMALRKISMSTLKQYLGITSSPPPPSSSYSTEAEAVINAIQATGLTLAIAQKDACNKRIADMKTAGIWAKRIAYYGFLGGTANAHSINWKSPGTYNIIWQGNMMHSLSGIQSDGSNGYGDTGLTESLFNPETTHISAYCRTSESFRAARDVGNITNDTFQLIIAFEGRSFYRSFNHLTDIEAITPTSSTGYFLATRNIGNSKIYRNGISYKSTIASQGNNAPTAGNLTICRATNTYTSKQFASVGLGIALSDAEAINDYDSEQAYQTSLNRQV